MLAILPIHFLWRTASVVPLWPLTLAVRGNVVVFVHSSWVCVCISVCVNCLIVYLSVRGENPKEHAVRQELVSTVKSWLLLSCAVLGSIAVYGGWLHRFCPYKQANLQFISKASSESHPAEIWPFFKSIQPPAPVKLIFVGAGLLARFGKCDQVTPITVFKSPALAICLCYVYT